MKRFAVSYINFVDNQLSTKIIESENWKSAILARLDGMVEGNPKRIEENHTWLDRFETLEEVKEAIFDGDMMMDVVEIP